MTQSMVRQLITPSFDAHGYIMLLNIIMQGLLEGERITVQFNYNFIFICMYTHGTTRELHCIPITCLHGPRFLPACNMHVLCNLSCKHAWNKLNTCGTKHACKFLTHQVSSTTTVVSNTRSPSDKLSCKQCFNSVQIKSLQIILVALIVDQDR